MARETSQTRQADLARRIGIHPDRLAGYEHGKNPVPYWIGDQIARATGTNQRWLATGTLPVKTYINVSQSLREAVPKSASFLTVYSLFLAEHFEQIVEAYSHIAYLTDGSMRFLKSEAPLYATPTEESESSARGFGDMAYLLSLMLKPPILAKFLADLEALCGKYSQDRYYREKGNSIDEVIKEEIVENVVRLRREWEKKTSGLRLSPGNVQAPRASKK